MRSGLNTELDVCANRHGGDPHSYMAHGQVNAERDRLLVLRHITKRKAYGSTLDEACVSLRRKPNEISGRFTELKRDGAIRANGDTRPTRTGCPAKVYVAIGGVGEQTEMNL